MRFLEVFSLRFFFVHYSGEDSLLDFYLMHVNIAMPMLEKIVSYEITHEISIFLFIQNTPVQVDNYTLHKDFETQFINEDFQIQSIYITKHFVHETLTELINLMQICRQM